MFGSVQPWQIMILIFRGERQRKMLHQKVMRHKRKNDGRVRQTRGEKTRERQQWGRERGGGAVEPG